MNFLTWQSVLNTENLQKAYEHVQKKRKENGPNSDWYLTGPIDLKTLQNHLLSGKYTPSPVEELHLKLPKKDTVLWRRTPIDAIVLRAIYQVLLPAIKLLLPKSPFHLPGKGGVKKAISLLNGVFQARKKESGFILRTDVKDFYQSIRHEELFSLLDRLIEDKELNAILKLLIKTPTYKGGIYQDWFGLGISKGCSLSPLFGALILANVDSHFARRVQRTPGIIYIRYMDDFFIFAPKRSLLRPLIR